MWPLVAMAALSAAASYVGSRQTNSANQQMANNQMAFQEAQTQQQQEYGREMVARQEAFQRESTNTAMAFSERMSNTSYQRGVEDMRAAGLNPMLAYQQGGATAPQGVSSSGASASTSAMSGATAHMENALGQAASSAMQGAQLVGQLEQTFANVDQTKAATQLIQDQRVQTQANTALQHQQAINAGFERGNIKARLPLLEAQTGREHSSAAHLDRDAPAQAARPDLMASERDRNYGQLGLSGSQERLNLQQSGLLQRYGDAEAITRILRGGTDALGNIGRIIR